MQAAKWRKVVRIGPAHTGADAGLFAGPIGINRLSGNYTQTVYAERRTGHDVHLKLQASVEEVFATGNQRALQ